METIVDPGNFAPSEGVPVIHAYQGADADGRIGKTTPVVRFARHFRAFRPLLAGAMALIVAYAAIQSRASPAPAKMSIATDRLQALALASTLLTSRMTGVDVPPPPAGTVDSSPSAHAEAVNGPGQPSDSAEPTPARNSRSTTQARLPGASGETPASERLRRARDNAGLPSFASGSRSVAWHANHVPVNIEGTVANAPDTDALAGISVRSTLRVLDPSRSPLTLVATRSGEAGWLALLQRVDIAGGAPSSTGWLSVGGMPLPGWQLLEISTGGALLLNPLGNLLRLRLASMAPSTPTARPEFPNAGRSAPALQNDKGD